MTIPMWRADRRVAVDPRLGGVCGPACAPAGGSIPVWAGKPVCRVQDPLRFIPACGGEETVEFHVSSAQG